MGIGAHFVVPIARWCVWPAGRTSVTESPDVRFVDASLRRRLGPLARMMLHVAHACAQDIADLRLVFASRHGELGYTVALLMALLWMTVFVVGSFVVFRRQDVLA